MRLCDKEALEGYFRQVCPIHVRQRGMSFVHPPTVFGLMIGSLITMIDLCMYYHHRVEEQLAKLNQDFADMTARLQKQRDEMCDPTRFLVTTRRRVTATIASRRANMHSPSLN